MEKFILRPSSCGQVRVKLESLPLELHLSYGFNSRLITLKFEFIWAVLGKEKELISLD
jgi:hypothetical protein